VKRFHLRALAHARSGDKGDTSNIGVIAYAPEYYPLILDQITPERVKQHFGDLVRGPVTRYALPRVHAINLVLEQALGGGVTRSLSLDPHGKSYSALVLGMAVAVPDAIAERLEREGRQPIAADEPS